MLDFYCATLVLRPNGTVVEISTYCSTDVDSAGQRSTVPLGLQLQLSGAHGCNMCFVAVTMKCVVLLRRLQRTTKEGAERERERERDRE